MATISDILESKGHDVYGVDSRSCVLAAAERMCEKQVGALMVTDRGRLVGILTERDILRRITVGGLDPAATRVSDVMTTEVACAVPETTLDECRAVMKERRIRYLPVMDRALGVVGVISITDLNAHEAAAQAVSIYYLNEYLYGAKQDTTSAEPEADRPPAREP